MDIKPTDFPEVKLIDNFCQYDIRGNFIKLFNEEDFKSLGVCTDLKEIYYSTSQRDVIRGMHFQMPPSEHDKIIHVLRGEVMDVVLDIRKSSVHYGEYITVHLSANRPRSVYIPKGFAHGFRCLANHTIMLYQVTSGYDAVRDCGIAYDSIGYDWGVQEPIVSQRDSDFVALKEFESPFE